MKKVMNKNTAWKLFKTALLVVLPLIGLISLHAHAEAEPQVIELKIKDHKFSLDKLKVKANQIFKIKITNEDLVSEEFESKTMIVEKFIGPKRTLTISIGPLKAGTYDYFGDFHRDTAVGVLTAE